MKETSRKLREAEKVKAKAKIGRKRREKTCFELGVSKNVIKGSCGKKK